MIDQQLRKHISLEELCNFTPKQNIAYESMFNKQYVLYGGARGGGKSRWLRGASLRFLLSLTEDYGLTNVHTMLASETYPALKDRQINKIATEFPEEIGVVKDSLSGGLGFHIHQSLGGGVIDFRNLDDPAKYQSAEFAAIAVDELTKNHKRTFDILRGSLRWPGLEHTPFIAATNPGSKGHGWVKDLWIDRNFQTYPELLPKANEFQFIQSLPSDNPYLTQSYWDELKSLPENMSKAWLEGNWDVFRGMAFPNFNRDRHVLKTPIALPAEWPRWCAVDWGYRDPFCCLWFCKDPGNGRVFVYREMYQRGMTDKHQAKAIRAASPPDEKISLTYADPSMWAKKNLAGLVGTSVEEYSQNGIQLEKGDNNRLNGKRKIDRLLGSLEDGLSGLVIFPQCQNLVRTLGSLALDDINVEDVDTDQEDHAYDALRYGLTRKERHSARKEWEGQDNESPLARLIRDSDIF